MKGAVQKEMRQNANNDVVAQRREFISPEVNIFENHDGYVVEAEMPGVNKDGLEIMLEGTELTIYGRRHVEGLSGDPLLCECPVADYRRVFELDPAIDATRISAKMNQGILTLTLPKSEQVKPRKIKVE